MSHFLHFPGNGHVLGMRGWEMEMKMGIERKWGWVWDGHGPKDLGWTCARLGAPPFPNEIDLNLLYF